MEQKSKQLEKIKQLENNKQLEFRSNCEIDKTKQALYGDEMGQHNFKGISRVSLDTRSDDADNAFRYILSILAIKFRICIFDANLASMAAWPT